MGGRGLGLVMVLVLAGCTALQPGGDVRPFGDAGGRDAGSRDAGGADAGEFDAGGVDAGEFDAGCVLDCCGNAIPEGEESCDDGDDESGDGCEPNCMWTCDVFPPTWYVDCDGDGHAQSPDNAMEQCEEPPPEGGCGWTQTVPTMAVHDCDDACVTCYPGGEEMCDGLDNDCDGTPPAEFTTYYLDSDGDGFGDPMRTMVACTAPAGYVADSSDCDDTLGTIRPGATEICNFRDDDCDALSDEGLPTSTYYRDADADSYGVASMPTTSCAQPTGYATTAGDCNDANAAISPGNTETCNGIDDDCDGTPDDGVRTTYYRDADGDTYGSAAVTMQACSVAPSGYVSNNTDCCDSDVRVRPTQTGWFTAPNMCGNYNYNCSASVERQYTSTTCCSGACTGGPGWSCCGAGCTPPACGVSATYASDCVMIVTMCVPSASMVTQGCH